MTTYDSTAGAATLTSDVDMGEDLNGKPKRGKLDSVKTVAADAAEGAASIARTVPDQVDQVAATTSRVVGDAQRAIEQGSDEALLAGTVLTTGLAMGLLLGRAPRFAVALALVPAVAMGTSLLQRRGFGLGTSMGHPTAN